MDAFDGFQPADFEAFAEAKWSSHAFNRGRLEVKLKLTALGRLLERELASELPDQEMGLTEERPSVFNQQKVRDLSLFFYRNGEARRALRAILDRSTSMAEAVLDPAPHHKHVVLGVRVHSGGLGAGLWLHRDAWVDWKNAVERCRNWGEGEKLGHLLAALPPEVRFGRGEVLTVEHPAARDQSVEAVLAGFETAAPWTMFGAAFAHHDQLLAGPELTERLTGLLRGLLPLHGFVAWRSDNDFHGLKVVVQQEREKAQRRYSDLQPGDKVRVLRGLAGGRLGVIDAIEHKGQVKVRLGAMTLSLKLEDLGPA